MQSVGESMAIGRTFNEALQKGLRSLEIGVAGLETRGYDRDKAESLLRTPQPERIFAVGDAFRADVRRGDPRDLVDRSLVPARDQKIIEMEKAIDSTKMLALKREGFSDKQIAALTNTSEDAVRRQRTS